MSPYDKSNSSRPSSARPAKERPGSKSPKHRGYRPEPEAAPKKSWDAAERTARADARSDARGARDGGRGRDAGRPARDGAAAGRPNWEPRKSAGSNPRFSGGREDRDARNGARGTEGRGYGRSSERGGNDRFGRDDRAPRNDRFGRDDRAPRNDRNDRFGRDDRAPRNDRFGRDDRAPRGGDRDDRGARRFDRDDRPARSFDRAGSDDRDRSPRNEGRAPFVRRDDYGSGRPARDDRNRDDRNRDDRNRDDRAPRGERFDRDRTGADRPARNGYDRDQRAPRSFDRDSRDTRDSRDARPSRDDRGGRPARSFDRDSRDNRDTRDSRETRASHEGRDAAVSRDARGNRPARAFDRDSRDSRETRDTRPSRDDRAPRRDTEARSSDFYPQRDAATHYSPADDVKLEKLQAEVVTAGEVEGVTWADLGLGDNITRQLQAMGAESPFPIQAATIPDVIKGRDVLGRGRTGSGKTIAFGAPLVEKLMENGGGKKRAMGRKPRALILAPTRELALQIDRTVQPIARSVGLFTTQIYGGVPQGRQVGALSRGVDIVIGTPGRIEDLVEQGRLDLSEVVVTVLDEADHMCDLGFLEPVQRIIRETAQVTPTGARAQKLLFSATLDRGVAALVDEFLVEPAVHEVAGEDQASSTIDHRVLLIEQRDKVKVIEQLAQGAGKTLVFARTRAFAEQLAEQLEDAGIATTSLHGDLNQSRRTRNLQQLTSGRVNVLVATDVAARGIHVDDIELVIQADAPDEYKTYMHRSGRTGRAGKEGTVVTLITRQRRRRMEDLLDRAEITAEMVEVRPGDRLIDQLAGA